MEKSYYFTRGNFFERLKKYYSDIGKVLRGESDVASIFSNTTDIGQSREMIYVEVLKQHLPSVCNVSLGGFLFNQNGVESKQIDVMIINDLALQFNFLSKDGSGKSFACIDGCVGLVSVKSTLDKRELIDSLKNIASIPGKQSLTPGQFPPNFNIGDYDEWPYKVVYASDGIGQKKINDYLREFYAENSEIPFHKRPNIIHVAGKYVFVRLMEGGSVTPDGVVIAPGIFYGSGRDPDVFALFCTFSKLQNIALRSRFIAYNYDGMLQGILPPKSLYKTSAPKS